MTERRNSRKPWKEEDDAMLRRLIAARERPAQLAKKLGRTQDSIRGRAAQLGLMLPSAIRPWKISFPRGPRRVDRLDTTTENKSEETDDE